MKIESHSAQAQMPPAAASQETRQPHGPPKADKHTTTAPSVVVDISTEAEETVDSPAGLGKSAMSPAHRARAMMAEYQALGATMSDVPFGQIVSHIARGMDPSEFFSLPEPEPDGDVVDGPAGEVGDAIDAGVGDALAEGVGSTSDEAVGDAVATVIDTVADGAEASTVDDGGDGSEAVSVTDASTAGADEGATATASTTDAPDAAPVDAETSLAEALLAATTENIAAEPEASLVEMLLESEDEASQG